MNKVSKGFILLALIGSISLFVFGCSKDHEPIPVKEDTDNEVTTNITNEETIQSVIEKEFNGPDVKYQESYQLAMSELTTDMSEEEYAAYSDSEVNQELIQYTNSSYASFFTDEALEVFTYSNPAFQYSAYPGNHKFSTSDIVIVQDSTDPSVYSFVFQVEFTPETGETSTHQYEGTAKLSESGKIETIEFLDKNNFNGNFDQISLTES